MWKVFGVFLPVTYHLHMEVTEKRYFMHVEIDENDIHDVG
jgi:hypothetical protein